MLLVILSIINWFTVIYITHFLKIQYKYPYLSFPFPFHWSTWTNGNILPVHVGIGRLYYIKLLTSFPLPSQRSRVTSVTSAGRVLGGSVELPLAGEPIRLALTEFKHINKHVFVRMGTKCTSASGSSTLPRRTRPYRAYLRRPSVSLLNSRHVQEEWSDWMDFEVVICICD
jgi:hypothetical protein